ncbi:unnamed protein product [Musa acuminata var. zebrina]
MLNSSCISSEASSLDQSDTRNKLSNSLDSSTTSLPGCLISGNSSGSVCDNPSAVGSDFWSVLFQRWTRELKKFTKEREKGKQYKRTASRKVLTDSNVQCEENNYSASAFETSESSSLSSSAKHVLDIKLSDEATPPDLLFTDVTVEKHDSANNVEFIDCSTTLLSCTSYSDEMDDFEPVSSPQIFARDEFRCNTTAYLDLSSTIKDAVMVPFSSDGSTREVVFKENNIFHDNFSSISMDNYNSVVDSSFDGSNSDIGENSSDDTVMRSPVKDESQPSSSEGEIFSPSKELIQHESSSHTTVNLCSVNTDISNNCYTSDAYLSNDVLDACSSTERADCSSQAGSNDDFHPVIAGKRGRRSRRIIGNGSLNGTNRYFTANNHGHTGKDNNYSIWQKVQKIERKEGASKPNNVNVLSPHGEVSSKETKTKMKLNKFVGLKQKQCGTTYRYPCPDDTFKIEASQAAPNCHKTVQPLSKSAVGNSVNSVKSKSSSAVKHANQCNTSGSHTGKSDMDKALKHHVQQKECLRNSSFTAVDKDHNIGFRSPNNSFSQRCLAKPTDDCCQPEPEKEIHVHTEEATPPRNTCNGVCLMDLPAVHSEIGQTPTTMNQIGHRQIEGNSEVGPTKYRESSSLSSSAGNLIQKWLSSCPRSAEASDLHAEINFQTNEMKDKEFNSVATELDKIIQAVNDAYKLQTMAEVVQLVTGRPCANFEKFLFLASHNSFCCHQIPNIALKSIWQWYEEPGCFGLEVRAHDYCNSRRQHNGRSEFTAYFVPYLSAVQLFGKSRSARYCNRSGEAAITCEEDKREKYLGSFPNLSMLLPQPLKDTNACLSESSSSAAEEIFDKSIHMDHAELFFEYFESDQPPWRRPLYEKIKELVSGDKLPASRIFGDPLKLESLNLHDLHPASWYCVAWYPIYRIPDGNFHAAFLTYHSLGHFVHQSASACVPGAFTNVVSPVVGLQTYRDKARLLCIFYNIIGENWFQPRDMDLKGFQSEEAHFSNTSDLLKERLRTLKQTASVMARAVVHKRDQRSANRHPDYEFFVSRSW